MNLKIIDDFYKKNDFEHMMSSAMLNPYKSTLQPTDKFFISRTSAYPCHETTKFLKDTSLFEIFIKTFEEKTGFIIEDVNTFFRKIYSNELEHVLKYGIRPHTDDNKYNIAGVIYYNTFSLNDGTAIFSEMEKNNCQIEPDIIVGSKPNRCVFYNSSIWHRPLQDKNTEVRIIQPFFIKLKT